MKKYNITIGIPAYNEEANIQHLLKDLLSQKIDSFELKKIIIASDGSTDKTVEKVKAISDPRITVIDSKARLGKSARQNEIISRCNADALLMLDADILISDPLFINKMIAPLVDNEAEMTSAALKELPARTFFEKVLDVSMKLKGILFNEFKGGNNVYTCHGPARAFSKDLYKQIIFNKSRGEDMYSYLFCVKAGKKFLYIPDAKVGYRLPSNPTDHYKQSSRYMDAIQDNEQIFGESWVKQEFKISYANYLRATQKAFPYILKNLPFVISYLLVLLGVIIAKALNINMKETWGVNSSKVLHV